MATIATKIRVGTAAVALAAATSVLPVQTALAEPTAPAPASPVSTQVLGTKALLNSDNFALQGNLGCLPFGLLCIGPASGAPPGQQILNIPLLGWWMGNLAICTFGISVKKGPYGSLSISRSSSC